MPSSSSPSPKCAWSATGTWPERSAAYLRRLAEPEDGPSIARVSALARELDLGIGVGLLTECDGWLFNSYAVCLPDGTVHIHRKLHASEHEAISDGGRYTVFDTPWDVRVGVLICHDNNLVENVRATALLGAQILLAPHQTGGTHSMSPFGEARSRCRVGEPRDRPRRRRGRVPRNDRARVAAALPAVARP